MNRNKLILFFTGLALACMIAVNGHLFLALALWIAFDSMLAPRMAACYVNSLGTLNSALIMQEALSLLSTKRPVLKYFATGFTDEKGVQAKYNQQVLVRTKSVATVGDFLTDADLAVTTVDVPVTLNKWKHVFVKFTPDQYESTSRDLIREQAEPIAVAIGNYIIDSCAALMTTVNFTGAARKTVKGAGWDYTHLTAVRQALNLRGAPDDKRFYLAAAPVYTSLLNDPMIVAAFNNPANALAIQNGMLPTVAGLGIQEYPGLATAAADVTVMAFAGTPGSIVVGSRAPQSPQNFGAQFPGLVGYITDPKSGFSIRVSEWIDTSFNANVRADWIFGVAKGQLDEGQVVTNV